MTAFDVVIVGGGYTGAIFAIHLSRLSEQPLDIAIVEPRGRLGYGLAYDTADPDHRLNAPIPVHFVYPDLPDHLHEWYVGQGGLERDPEAQAEDGNIFMRREEFGRYVEEQLSVHTDSNPSGSNIRHIRSRVADAQQTAQGYRLALDDGRTLSTRQAVLAVGYDRPHVPPPFDGVISDHPGFHSDPWNTARIRQIPDDSKVLLLGMAQTASDVIAVLLRSGHRGSITVISRHGLYPRKRPIMESGAPPDVVGRIVRPVSLFTAAHGRFSTARGLLRTLRSEARRAEEAGGTWLEPFGDLRDSVWDVWPALPLEEKGRFLRHLRAWYDAHRFQLAPQIETIIAERKAAGQVVFEAASCVSAARQGDRLSVTLLQRHSGTRRREQFDAIVNCTGPGTRPDQSTNPFVRTLVTRGYAIPHPVGVGFSVDAECRAIDASGRADPHLRIVGPPVYGTFADQQGATFIALRLHQIMPLVAASLYR